jgi:hypothetical protein
VLAVLIDRFTVWKTVTKNLIRYAPSELKDSAVADGTA